MPWASSRNSPKRRTRAAGTPTALSCCAISTAQPLAKASMTHPRRCGRIARHDEAAARGVECLQVDGLAVAAQRLQARHGAELAKLRRCVGWGGGGGVLGGGAGVASQSSVHAHRIGALAGADVYGQRALAGVERRKADRCVACVAV